ncbi:MAG: hypothetical protein EHM21_03870 [Chloroflexi bacterium]|nr:MAG: hypothetical protein EHM21_03870 [Chloroflexota bacterium]
MGMDEGRIRQGELFGRLPGVWGEDLLPAIQARLQASGRKVVVLDDDPTGTQTVHGVPVLTEWPVERLVEELNGPAPAVYLLTNSRSLAPVEAEALNAAVGEALQRARARSGKDFGVISRSDSTLRGHFPGEVAALARGLQPARGGPLADDFDAWLVAPCFPEGGRLTVNNVHYVAEGEWLVPAGQTEFARDKSFGYRSSNLREWVAEKTGGAVRAEQVAVISLEDLRLGGPAAVTEKLLALPRGTICAVNAAGYRDLEVLVLGLLEAEAQGRRYLYRTAASFVRVRAGIAPRALLERADLKLPRTGAGLVVAGSYVPRTSQQLEALFKQTKIHAVEVRVHLLLDVTSRNGEIARVREAVSRHLAAGEDVAVFTSRELVVASAGAAASANASASANADEAEANLAIGRAISDGLVDIVSGLKTRPRYLLAKGGITSSDVATRGLGIRRALVLGQIMPGVPVWRSGPESRYPGLAYVVFPGNVGGADALAKIVRGLR